MKNNFVKFGMIILTVISIACCITIAALGLVCIKISTNLIGIMLGAGLHITGIAAFILSFIQMKDVIQDKHITVTN